LAGVSAHSGPTIRLGELSFEPDDAPVGRELDARFPRIAWNERADRPRKGRDVLTADQSVQRIVTAAGQLDERAERVVPLEANRGSGGSGRERMNAKKRIGASERDVPGEGLLERDDRKGAREEPRRGGRRDDSDRDYQDRNSGSGQATAPQGLGDVAGHAVRC
jgi:hypothetical protein